MLPRGNEKTDERHRRFAFGGADIQRALLEADGIEFTEDGRVDMAKYGWTGLG